ncbi:MAG TPA: UbiA family prenyltransferase [Longimicrobium sp.]|nr:UbiA family prenyltransferase [Longimicrobium sp.]
MWETTGVPAWKRPAATAALARVSAAVRWQEWYASKLPFAWTACASAAASSRLGNAAVLRRTAAVILFTCLCAAFGHVANDHADRECDRSAGRLRPAAALTRHAASLVLVALGAAALGVLAMAATSPAAAAAGIAGLALSAAYSLGPLRLKERGAAGVWSAAAAQRTLPVLLAFAALRPLGAQAWAFAAVAQLAGVRWMLVHQVADAANDRRAGVATYVAAAGEARARALLRRVVFPLELLALAAALWTASASTPAVWRVAAAGALASGVWAALWHGKRAPYSFDGYGHQPLAGFYQAVWPIGAGVLLAASRPALWPVGAAFLLWESRFIALQLATALRLLRERVGAWAGATGGGRFYAGG